MSLGQNKSTLSLRVRRFWLDATANRGGKPEFAGGFYIPIGGR